MNPISCQASDWTTDEFGFVSEGLSEAGLSDSYNIVFSFKPRTRRAKTKLGIFTLLACILAVVLAKLSKQSISDSQSTSAPSTPPVQQPNVLVSGLSCSNAALARGEVPWAADAMPGQDWDVHYATVLQRHWDRWIYSHDLIHNYCWHSQLNSTHP